MSGKHLCDECGTPLVPDSSKFGRWWCERCAKHRRKSHQEKYGVKV